MSISREGRRVIHRRVDEYFMGRQEGIHGKARGYSREGKRVFMGGQKSIS
jgi:hypothetical protein